MEGDEANQEPVRLGPGQLGLVQVDGVKYADDAHNLGGVTYIRKDC